MISEKRQQKKMKVERDLLPVKAINFFYQAGLACIISYKTIFQKQLGISPQQNGLVAALEKIAHLIAPPLFGAVADKFSAHKTLMIVCCLTSVMAAVPMYFIPPVALNEKAYPCWYNGTLMCNNSMDNTACHMSSGKCDDETLLCETENPSYCLIQNNETSVVARINSSSQDSVLSATCFEKITDEVYGVTFSLIVLLSILFTASIAPLGSIIDATAVNMLGEERVNDFGKQRLWGAVGFGLVALLTGFLIDMLTGVSCKYGEKNYLFAFVGVAVFMAISVIVCLKLNVPKYKLQSLLSGINILVRNFRIAIFLLVIFVTGFVMGARYAYLFWYIEQLPGSSQTLLGFSILAACLGEIPIFFISGWVAEKIGYNAMLTLGLLILSFQCFLYTLLSVAWPVLLIELLQGIAFGFPMAAMISYASVLAPKGMTATLVGLTQGIYWGLGNMAGSLVAGVLYEQYGPKAMFSINAGIGTVSAFLYFAVVLILDHLKKKENLNEEERCKADDPLNIARLTTEEM
ncbi:unnamed protein product [Clavelina lepadiformis]|uniref:Major facilitator superfamily (MFS) profile domain-containing protein n=2 Tax=Clavelina lepadiformis TaxID=159417 RepID=A0ABP0GAP1_CLALP